MKKLSFLDRLTGGQTDDMDRILDDDHEFGADDDLAVDQDDYAEDEEWADEDRSVQTAEPQDGELPVDMYQTDDEIIVRAIVAGVDPSDLEISITRDMVTVRGVREEYQEAQEKHGMLEIRMPKLDKHRSTQLRVKTGAGHK